MVPEEIKCRSCHGTGNWLTLTDINLGCLFCQSTGVSHSRLKVWIYNPENNPDDVFIKVGTKTRCLTELVENWLILGHKPFIAD